MIGDLVDEVERDSGLESLGPSKDDTPERRPEAEDTMATPSPANTICIGGSGPKDDLDDEPDESLSERLWGLTEMFPEGVRNATYKLTTNLKSFVKTSYSFSRTVVWIVASSSVILFAPVIFEVERAQMEEIQKSQQKQSEDEENEKRSNPPRFTMQTLEVVDRLAQIRVNSLKDFARLVMKGSPRH